MGKILSLHELITNEPTELEIPGLGTVLVREPTVGDRLEARSEVLKLDGYDKMTDLERDTEVLSRVCIKAIVEPKITMEDYLKLPVSVQTAILDVVSAYFNKRILDLMDARRGLLESFLPQTKVKNP